MKKIIQIGAEAVIYQIDSNTVIKERIKKSYRLPELDDTLRKRRTRREGKVLQKTTANVPSVSRVNDKTMQIEMQYIDGQVLSNILDTSPKQSVMCKQVGEQIAILHNEDIIHGDLTTSNMLLHKGKIYLVDFGLAFFSHKREDKAVDLRLLKQAINSKHYRHATVLITEILKSYQAHAKEGEAVLERLNKVENRGRYKRKGQNRNAFKDPIIGV